MVQNVGNNTMKARRYSSGNEKYRKSPSTTVCENRSSSVCDRNDNKRNHLKRYCTCDGKEVDKVRDRNAARKRALPMKKLPPSAKVVSKEEYEEYKKCSYVPTEEEKEAAMKLAEEERERLLKESKERKEEFRRIDLARPRDKSPTLIEIEEEARKRTMHILERAHNMRLEQEEEIQKCNRLILETKCRAIRDAQITEKKLIDQELAEEEKRLNEMMENERRWAIKEELKKEQEVAAKKQELANMLKEQITENEEQRILEFERKQEESRLINLSNIAWQQEEIAKLQNKAVENARIRRNLAEGNEQLKHFKAMEAEENRIIDLRIREYQKRKEEKEAEIAEKRKLEKLKKERDKSMVATQTEHTQDLQARIDEINAARIQEEVEREWRQKEKEEAEKRIKTQMMLKKEREEQINNKRIMEAIELERERREFEKIVRVQKEAFCREQKEIEMKQRKALLHRSEILKQVNEKERERIKTRQKMFEEGLAIRTEAEIRKKKLRETMERKCQEMKIHNVPDIYINEVKHMIENIR